MQDFVIGAHFISVSTCMYMLLVDPQSSLLCSLEFSLPVLSPLNPHLHPHRNAIPFTPTQVEAIRSGMQPGLTLVVGPPGTGKTDVAVQIISNIYHNFPEQVSSV